MILPINASLEQGIQGTTAKKAHNYGSMTAAHKIRGSILVPLVLAQREKETQLKANNSDLKIHESQVTVAHACNPSYSGGRDQEDQGLKPARVGNL
jgi:hypothetical protein